MELAGQIGWKARGKSDRANSGRVAECVLSAEVENGSGYYDFNRQ